MDLIRTLFFDRVYKAIEGDETDNDYLENIASVAVQAIEVPFVGQESRKNSSLSEYYREEGNKAYKDGLLQLALVNYNQAICYAPNGSLCLKFAYSNRSAVLFSGKAYEACKEDCITALAIDCVTPQTLTEKLKKRITETRTEQKKCLLPIQRDKAAFEKYADEFFKLKSRNSDVPCASADVGIIIESGIPKVIAKNDIAAGALVALEKAFVTWSPNDFEQYNSCHYCRRLCLNLFPCSGCVTAMFCSKQCEESCMAEYHTDECKIAGLITDISFNKKWIIKAILKLKNMCASWDELIAMSHDYGYNRIEKGTVNDIFDGENPSSVLSFHKNRHFLHGILFKSVILSAQYLNLLQNVQSFFPEDRQRKLLAMKAMARIMIYLQLNATPTILCLPTKVNAMGSIEIYSYGHLGLFPFAGKLKHSCMPNLQTLAMNNTIGLVALEQIKAGTELTVSHIFHWIDNDLTIQERRQHMFNHRHTFCTCVVCSSNPEKLKKKGELTAAQKTAIQECFSVDRCRVFGIPIQKCFDKIYKALTCLHNIKISEDYFKVYRMLSHLQLYVLHNKMHNSILSKVEPITFKSSLP